MKTEQEIKDRLDILEENERGGLSGLINATMRSQRILIIQALKWVLEIE